MTRRDVVVGQLHPATPVPRLMNIELLRPAYQSSNCEVQNISYDAPRARPGSESAALGNAFHAASAPGGRES